MSLRLRLENFIFYRAACLNVCVEGESERLYCYCFDPCLQVLIYLYNDLFGSKKLIGTSIVVPPSKRGGVKNGWILPGLDENKPCFIDKNFHLCYNK